MVGNHILHVSITLDVSSQRLGYICLMVGNSTTVTGTLVHSYFLLPNLWVCKPCIILRYATYEAVKMSIRVVMYILLWLSYRGRISNWINSTFFRLSLTPMVLFTLNIQCNLKVKTTPEVVWWVNSFRFSLNVFLL